MTGTHPGLDEGAIVAGRYRVGRRLGMGGMGTVYLAVQEPLGRTVVLKTLRPDLFGDPVAVERFKNEANVIATLAHPHIVGVYDFGSTAEGTLYLAMEYVQGKTLADTLRIEGVFSSPRALRVVRDVARGLAAAHRRGIVHRDLKPENVMLLEAEGVRDFVKVLDFGIAKAVRVEGDAALRLTGSGLVPGTPGYIAPEQIVGGGDDPRSDLYALGVTWFELLTGKRPFAGENAMKMFLAQLEAPIPVVQERAPGVSVPAPVEALLHSLLAKDPAGRPASAEALLAAIAELEEAGFGASTDPSTPRPFTPSSGAGALEGVGPSSATETSHSTPGLSVPGTRFSPAPPSTTPPSQTPPSTLPSTTLPSTTQPTPTTGTAGSLTLPTRSPPSRLRRALRYVPVAVIGLLCLVLAVMVANPWSRALLAGDDALPIATFDVEVARSVHMSLGAFLAGDLEASLEAADTAERKHPGEPGALFMRALVSEWRRELLGPRDGFVAAWALVDDGHMLFPGKMATMDLMEAVAAAAVAESPDAVLQTFEERSDDCLDSYLGKVVAAHFMAMGDERRLEEALSLLDAAIAEAPEHALAYAEKASILRQRGRHDDALAAARAGLARSSAAPTLVVELGRTLLARGEAAAAVRELRGAFERTVPLDAQLLLASAMLLDGAHEQADRLVDTLFENTHSQVLRARIARAYGSALAGAGRPRRALSLFERSVASSREARAGDEAARTLLGGVVALEALGDGEEVRRLLDLGRALLDDLILSQQMAANFHTVQVMSEGIFAVRAGDLAGGRAKLAALEANAHIRPAVKDGVLSNLRYEVALATGDVAGALALTPHARGWCQARAREAEAYAKAGRTDDAAGAWQALVDAGAVCRASEHHGAFVLRALVALAENAPRGSAPRAEQLARLAAWFPHVEEGSALGRRIAALRSAPPPSTVD